MFQYGNDGLFGAPQSLVKEFAGINPDEYGGRSFQAGRILGSAIVMVQGAIEFLAGLGGGGVGLATTPVGVGAVITPASAAVAAVGAGHTGAGFKGLQDSIRAFFSQETKGTSKGTRPPNLTPEGAGRNGAFREAKRNSGIPVSEQPKKVTPATDKRGNKIPGRDYDFGDGRVIREHSGGHTYPDDPSQNRGPHFNDINGNHYDFKK